MVSNYAQQVRSRKLLRKSVPKTRMTVSVEATDSKWYESIGKAIYGSHRAGFSGERFRVLIDGKPLEA